MSVDMALKVFGITADELTDKIGLKRTYRRLAMQHHPDRGGTKEMAQDVNDAYAVLSKASEKDIQAKSSMERWKEHDRKSREVAEQIKQALLSDFHPEIYQRYFKEYSGYDFQYEIIKTHQQWPGFEVEFFTKDRSTVFHLKVQASLNDVMRGGLGGGGLSYTVYTEAHGFHLNKKQKMSKSDWGFTNDHSFLQDPKKLFPPAKMKKIFSGATSKRSFKKRDMEAYLKSKMGAKLDYNGGQVWAEIPIGEDYYYYVYRSVFDRVPFWMANGVYKQKSKYSKAKVTNLSGSFPEEEETAKTFEKIQKELMKVSGDAKPKKAKQLMDYAYEAYKKSKGL